jgi:hypothetical protein
MYCIASCSCSEQSHFSDPSTSASRSSSIYGNTSCTQDSRKQSIRAIGEGGSEQIGNDPCCAVCSIDSNGAPPDVKQASCTRTTTCNQAANGQRHIATLHLNSLRSSSAACLQAEQPTAAHLGLPLWPPSHDDHGLCERVAAIRLHGPQRSVLTLLAGVYSLNEQSRGMQAWA